MFSLRSDCHSTRSSLTTQIDISTIKRVLSRQGYRLTSSREAFLDLQQLVDQNQVLFGMSFPTFVKKCLLLLNGKDQPEFMYRKPKALVEVLDRFPSELAYSLKVAPFAVGRPLLPLLAHLSLIKLKLLSRHGSQVGLQRFGPKSQNKVLLFEEEGHFWFAEKINSSRSNNNNSAKLGLPARLSASTCPSVQSSSEARKQNSDCHESTFNNSKDSILVKEEVLNSQTNVLSFVLLTGENSQTKADLAITTTTVATDSADKALSDGKTTKSCSAQQNTRANSITDSGAASPPLKKKAEGLTAFAYKQPDFKQKVIFEGKDFQEGRIKFFFEGAEFGFITTEANEDFFLHREDLEKAGIEPDQLAHYRRFCDIRVCFRFIEYKGKSKVSRKAVDIKVLEFLPFSF